MNGVCDIYSSTLGVIRVVAGRVRGAANAAERAKNRLCWQCVGEQVCRERSAEARSAEALRKCEARRAEPTWHSVHTEAHRAEGQGPKGRGEILCVVNMREQGSELKLVLRLVAQRPYGKARTEGPSRRGTVFILRPAGPKV